MPDADTRIADSTDVPESVFELAEEVGATAIVYRPLEDSRLMRVLPADISLQLVARAGRPVVALPRDE